MGTKRDCAPPAPHTSGAQTGVFLRPSRPTRTASVLIRSLVQSPRLSTAENRQLQRGTCNNRRDQRAPPAQMVDGCDRGIGCAHRRLKVVGVEAFVPFRLLVLGVLMPQPHRPLFAGHRDTPHAADARRHEVAQHVTVDGFGIDARPSRRASLTCGCPPCLPGDRSR